MPLHMVISAAGAPTGPGGRRDRRHRPPAGHRRRHRHNRRADEEAVRRGVALDAERRRALQVANVAPQVSGQILRLNVADNQFVRKGDLLYEIDPLSFEVAERIAQAAVDRAAADMQVRQAQPERRRLSNDATTPSPSASRAVAGGAATRWKETKMYRRYPKV